MIETSKGVIPIEVKLSPVKDKIERSLHSFISTYQPKKAIIVGYDVDEAEKEVDGCRVIFTDVSRLQKTLEA